MEITCISYVAVMTQALLTTGCPRWGTILMLTGLIASQLMTFLC